VRFVKIDEHYSGEPATVQLSTDCAVHEHDSWNPTNIHHIWPRGLGGPNTAANKIVVCMNGHGAIHAFLQFLIDFNGDVPYDISKHFGIKVKLYARQGWNEAGKPTTGGGGE
jgi:hypothetical protein